VIAEAIDTAITLGWALAAWIVLTAAAVCLAVYAGAVAVWWPCRAARDALAGALAASRALRALRSWPEPQRVPQRRTAPHAPTWAQHDEEVA
jgi:hypothetical protein